MSKRRQKKKRGKKSQKPQHSLSVIQTPQTPPVPKQPWWKKISKTVWNIIAVFSVIIGLLSPLPFAYRLSFPTTDLTERSQPLDGPFVLKNDGWLSVYDLHVSLVMTNLVLGNLEIGEIRVQDVWKTPELESNDSGTFGLSDKHVIFTPMPPDVLLRLEVTYCPVKWFEFRRRKTFLFHTRTATDGTSRWYPGFR